MYNFRIASVPHEKSANNLLEFHKFQSIGVCLRCFKNNKQDATSIRILFVNETIYFSLLIYIVYLRGVKMCENECFVSSAASYFQRISN